MSKSSLAPAGPIAFNQLGDLSQKAARRAVEGERVKVTVLATPNNPAIEGELRTKLDVASDVQTRAKITTKLDQRAQQPYGALFDPTGRFSVAADQFPGIDFEVHSVDAEPDEKQEEVNPNELRKKMDNALQRGSPADLEALFDSGMDINQEDYEGRTALMMCSAKGQKGVVEMLLERGADVNRVFMYKGRTPRTALDAARQSGQIEIEKILVAMGAKSGEELGADQ